MEDTEAAHEITLEAYEEVFGISEVWLRNPTGPEVYRAQAHSFRRPAFGDFKGSAWSIRAQDARGPSSWSSVFATGSANQEDEEDDPIAAGFTVPQLMPVGRSSTAMIASSPVYSLAFAQPGPNVCNAISNRPSLVNRTLVHIKTIPLTGPFAFGIDFGCPFQGCRYDADGKPGSVATAAFPFPGLREYALVLRVGTQVAQAGKSCASPPIREGRWRYALMTACLTVGAAIR